MEQFFFSKMETDRVLNNDNFNIVWTKVKDHLNLEIHVPQHENDIEEEKQEHDDEIIV